MYFHSVDGSTDQKLKVKGTGTDRHTADSTHMLCCCILVLFCFVVGPLFTLFISFESLTTCNSQVEKTLFIAASLS